MVNINSYNSPKIEILYCLEQLIENNSQICSTSNLFTQLTPATIYNISVSIHRDSFENRFFWTNQTIFKLVNTSKIKSEITEFIKFILDLSPLRIRTWKSQENCGAELLNTFPLIDSSECISNEGIFNCNELRCGCQYQFKIRFNQTMIDYLCLSSPCDIQLNDHNFTIAQIQTRRKINDLGILSFVCLALETVENLRIVSVSSREIQVGFDKPIGCFDQLILICESISFKQRRMFSNSTICTDLIPDKFYRIYVETKRTGWVTAVSNSIETRLDFTSNEPTKSIFH